jgi:SAM-dependent methyltransferase
MASQNVETLWKGREGPFPLHLGPGVFSPTTTSRTLADAIEITPGDTVIDVGCGSGVLAIVAAKLGAAKVYGVDLSQRAVEAARENARRLGLDHICEFRAGDLLEPVRDVQATVLIGDVSGIPDAIAKESGWFDDVPPAGRRAPSSRQVPSFDRRHPRDGWALVPPTGTIQHEQAILDAAHEIFGDHMRPVLEREFPLPIWSPGRRPSPA